MERNSFLGGTAASGLGILGYLDRQGRKALGGIAQELIDRLTGYGGAIGHYPCPVHNSITPISPDWFKIVAVEMCREAGVEVLFNSELLDATIENGRVVCAEVYGKCTRNAHRGEGVHRRHRRRRSGIYGGSTVYVGPGWHGIMQPCTLMFTVTNYNLENF